MYPVSEGYLRNIPVSRTVKCPLPLLKRLGIFASPLNQYFSQITLTNRIYLYNIVVDNNWSKWISRRILYISFCLRRDIALTNRFSQIVHMHCIYKLWRYVMLDTHYWKVNISYIRIGHTTGRCERKPAAFSLSRTVWGRYVCLMSSVCLCSSYSSHTNRHHDDNSYQTVLM